MGDLCPIQPCPEAKPRRAVVCDYHWRFVPHHLQLRSKVAWKNSDVAEQAWTDIAILRAIWWQLEEAGVPFPPDPDHVLNATCGCAWCGPILRKAMKIADVSQDFWEHLLAKKGLRKPAGEVAHA